MSYWLKVGTEVALEYEPGIWLYGEITENVFSLHRQQLVKVRFKNRDDLTKKNPTFHILEGVFEPTELLFRNYLGTGKIDNDPYV